MKFIQYLVKGIVQAVCEKLFMNLLSGYNLA